MALDNYVVKDDVLCEPTHNDDYIILGALHMYHYISFVYLQLDRKTVIYIYSLASLHHVALFSIFFLLYEKNLLC